ncbi:MAG: exodeoxyribonuclease V subunit gamma [Clostridia bacterium]|nr:exodeoxyribonuclease V subunit gamma [Clostridia bacterium]
MLQLILGRSGFGKTHTIRNIIKEKIDHGLDKLLLIIPEQYSFETERAILQLLGEALYDKISIMSFRKLSEYIFKKAGKPCGKVLSDSHKAILMNIAIDSVKDKLKIYKSAATNSEFVSVMLSANDEFKMCNIDNTEIAKIKSMAPDKTLSAKLGDTQLILNKYNELLEGKFIDPVDEITYAYRLCSQEGLFQDYTIFIDSFDGFTPQQLLFLGYFLKYSRDCFITFCTDKVNFSEPNEKSVDLFEPVNKHIRKVLDIAKKNTVKVNPPIVLQKNYRANEELSLMEKNFLRAKKLGTNLSKCQAIEIYNAKNRYDEVEFVAKNIRKLVEKKDYRYRDFFIISRNEQLYDGIIDAYFKKYKIPLFYDKKESIESKILITFLTSLIGTVKGNFQSTDIFRLLKIGLLDFDNDDIFNLENYVLLWGIDKKQWLGPFTENPRGLSGQMTDEDTENLEKLNILREKIMAPLLAFAKKLKSAKDGKEMTEEIYYFLEKVNLRKKINAYSENLLKAGEIELAAEQVEVWEKMIDIFEEMALLLSGEKITLDKYHQLLKIVLKLSDIGKIPAKLDEVTFGVADRIRPDDKKVVFLLGANEGEFPRFPATAGVFSDDERCQLLELGLNLYDSLEGLSLNERFLSYKAVTLAKEKLFVSFTNSTLSGEVNYPSEIVKELEKIFGNISIQDEKSFDEYDEVWAKEPAFEVLSKHFREGSRFSNTLKRYFENDAETKERVKLLKKVASKKTVAFEDQQSAGLLFKGDLKLSASQIESYYLCPFQFFCKYSLKAKPRKKVEFDSLEYGSLMHFVLEKILSKYKPSEIQSFAPNRIEKVIVEILNDYIKLKVGELKTKSDRFQYLFSRVVKTSVPLILHIADGLSQSEFKATDFELKIGKNGKVPALKLKLSSGEYIEVEGKIDRVDTYQKDGKSFVRVVDYKTGAKEFRLSDILYGLNLQMLVYLLALEKNPKSKNAVIPCGILYMPAQKPLVTAERNINTDDLNKLKGKKLKMNGLIIDSPEVIYAMEKDAGGVFIPAKVKNSQIQKSETLVNVAFMEKILQKIENLIVQMAENLKKGTIPAKPAKGLYDACEYCDYKSGCAFDEEYDEVVTVESLKNEEVENLLDLG